MLIPFIDMQQAQQKMSQIRNASLCVQLVVQTR